MMRLTYEKQPGLVRTLKAFFRILLGLFLLSAGISHLTIARVEFLAQVPDWLPLDGDLIVVISGIMEIALGAALLLFPRIQAVSGLAAAAFFIAIFSGNISQYMNGIDAFGLNSDQARFTRLFFQPLLVAWALWCTGAWPPLKAAQDALKKMAGGPGNQP
jgi:uncharacterized membrane protein